MQNMNMICHKDALRMLVVVMRVMRVMVMMMMMMMMTTIIS